MRRGLYARRPQAVNRAGPGQRRDAFGGVGWPSEAEESSIEEIGSRAISYLKYRCHFTSNRQPGVKSPLAEAADNAVPMAFKVI